MSDQATKGGLLHYLFSGQGMKLLNIKFFRGSDDVISGAQFRKELCAAEERKRTGAVKGSSTPPRCKQDPIDLKQFVADM